MNASDFLFTHGEINQGFAAKNRGLGWVMHVLAIFDILLISIRFFSIFC